MKKFICTVCGYVHEGDEAPEFCPQCKQPKSKFKELVETEGALTFVDEHRLGVAKGVDPEVLEGLRAHFNGECSEVGMYLAMSRQADREGYPEIAEAFKRYAWEEAEHAAKFAELLGENVWKQKLVLARIKNVLLLWLKNWIWMLSMIPFMKCVKTKPVTVKVSKAYIIVTSSNLL